MDEKINLLVLVFMLLVTVPQFIKSEDGTLVPTPISSEKGTSVSSVPVVTVSSASNQTDDCSNGTCSTATHLWKKIVENKDKLMRAFYVLIGVTSIVVLYFVVRAWRIRRRKNKSRKYGLITGRGTDLEMAPLDADDEDDEDMTVFEMNGKRK